MAYAKTLIKFIDADLVYGKTIIMVGTVLRTISSNDYRALISYAGKWQSGLERVFRKTHPATVLYFNEAHSLTAEGHAMARNIKKLLGL